MSKYYIRRDSKKYKLKYSLPLSKNDPPFIKTEGRLDWLGIQYFIIAIFLYIAMIILCVIQYKQHDRYWIVENICTVLFIGGFATLSLLVGFRSFAKGVPKGFRIKLLKRFSKKLLGVIMALLAIGGIIVMINKIDYSNRFMEKNIFISNESNARYSFILNTNETITVKDNIENKTIILSYPIYFSGATSIDENYDVRYKMFNNFSKKEKVTNMEYGEIINIKAVNKSIRP